MQSVQQWRLRVYGPDLLRCLGRRGSSVCHMDHCGYCTVCDFRVHHSTPASLPVLLLRVHYRWDFLINLRQEESRCCAPEPDPGALCPACGLQPCDSTTLSASGAPTSTTIQAGVPINT